MRRALSMFVTLLAVSVTCAEDAAVDLPGKLPDGATLLPNQWLLRPAGAQVPLGDGPVNSALHPSGRYLAVQHAGYSAHAVWIVDLQTLTVASKTPVPETFSGIEFSADGNHLYYSGGGKEVIHRYDFKDGTLANPTTFALRPVSERGVPAGLAVQADEAHIYAANVWGQLVSRVELSGEKKTADIPLSADPKSTAVSGVTIPADFDTLSAEKRAEALLDPVSPLAPFPYACKLDEKRGRLYVSLWAQSSVAVVDLAKNAEIARWKTEEHPTEMALTRDGKFLFVANANRNTVSVLDTEAGKSIETIWAAMHPDLPPGSTPISVALTPDEKILFVANACTNNVAVFNVEHPGKSEPLGFIPAGWYPVSVRVTPDGKRLAVVNGKGVTSLPNAPLPGQKGSPKKTEQYIGEILKGTVSVIDLPTDPAEFKTQMAAYTAHAYACTPAKKNAERTALRPADNPIPAKLGDATPLKYCIYVIKENRTYDQVLGDIKKGNGDPKLCIFGANVTPNLHKLCDEFVLLDNFYADGEVSADGHEWSCGAYATDFVEKFWPLAYGHAASGKYPYPSEGTFPVAYPAGGYIWDRAAEAGVSYRSYGEFATSPGKNGAPGRAKTKGLIGHIDEQYHTFDLNYSDLKRAERFISELQRFEKTGDMPRLQIVRICNDHTNGTGLGKPTPTAFVAENDVAVGMVVEALSKSKFWPNLAVFILEDDAQNGPDHVDAHRTTAYLASPYCKKHSVDSSMYSTSSMLRTMELILGLKPMSQFDAAALPMFNSFQAQADLTPFKKEDAHIDLNAKNKLGMWGQKESNEMDFADADEADDLALNEIVWRSVKGADSPMPAPVRAAFVFRHPAPAGGAKKKDDD